MFGGPLPEPTVLKIAKGNPGNRALNKDEPQPELGAPNPPTTLSQEAKAEWRRIVPELERMGLIAQIDRAALSVYCSAWADHQLARRIIGKEGHFYTNKLGTKCAHPMLRVLQESTKTISLFLQHFGLSPASRTRIKVTKTKGNKSADPMALLEGKKKQG